MGAEHKVHKIPTSLEAFYSWISSFSFSIKLKTFITDCNTVRICAKSFQ